MLSDFMPKMSSKWFDRGGRVVEKGWGVGVGIVRVGGRFVSLGGG